ncbi:hypothetical protein TKK_0011302 [Trichogramma kaykai]
MLDGAPQVQNIYYVEKHNKPWSLSKWFLPHCRACKVTRRALLYRHNCRCPNCGQAYDFECKRCNHIYTTEKAARNHYFYESNRTRLQCPHCPYLTFTNRNLEGHIQAIHNFNNSTS